MAKRGRPRKIRASAAPATAIKNSEPLRNASDTGRTVDSPQRQHPANASEFGSLIAGVSPLDATYRASEASSARRKGSAPRPQTHAAGGGNDDDIGLDDIPMTFDEIARAIGDDNADGRKRVKTLAKRHCDLGPGDTITLNQWRDVERIVAANGKTPVAGAKAPARKATRRLSADADALTRKRVADAERAELKTKKEAGDLLDRKAAIARITSIVNDFRLRLEALPFNVAGNLVGRSREDIEAALSEEIARALTDISRMAAP